MSFMKMRQLPARPGFGEQAKRQAQASRGQRRGPVAGQFNSWYPRENIAQWIAICPMQSWDYEAYDRETRQVLKFMAQYWFGYEEHRVAINKRRFTCSAGANKDKPCWGHGVINSHWARVRIQEEETGVKSDKKPAISTMQQFAMSIVVLENIAKVPVKNKDGTPRLSKTGKPIVNDVPLCLLEKAEADALKKKGVTTFGLSAHWSNGVTGLKELQAFDRELQNKCSNCAGDLKALVMACPECLLEVQVAEDPNEPLGGEDLLQAREAEYECECGFKGCLLPALLCSTCESPESGKLVDFALRVRTEKVSDTSRVLKLVEVKPLLHFVTKYPALEDMLMKPLDIPAIFAPEPLASQLYLIPENLRGDGVSPLPKGSDEPVATSYEFNSAKSKGAARNDDEDEDPTA